MPKLPTTPVGIGLWALGAILALGLVATVVYRLFFQGQDLARERGNRVVAEEQVKAEAAIVSNTLDAVQQRDVYREHITTIVRETNQEVNNAWTGENVGKDVDLAGSAALCRMHDSLCRLPAPTDMQPLR